MTDDVSGEMPVLPEGAHPIDIPQQEWVRDYRAGIQASDVPDAYGLLDGPPAVSGLVEVEAIRGSYRVAIRRGEHDFDFLWLSEGEMRDLREVLSRPPG